MHELLVLIPHLRSIEQKETLGGLNMSNYALPCVDLISTGQNIKKLRQQHNMSVRQLQDILGFTTPQAIYKWQWGECLPDIDNLLALSSLWCVPIENILVTVN